MDNYINSIITSLNNGMIRAMNYEASQDVKFLNETKEWIDVASIYLNQLLMEQKNEV